MNPLHAQDIFLYGKVIPKYRDPLTDQQMETYELLKVRLSGGMLIGHAITEVARVLNEDRSGTNSRVQTIKAKGWL